ncbi:alpha/beta fold hydrolase [Candidatus Poriferisodalis sp.]|uniref:alpha/beta fold hydrolase n=1 Tax=Candidatus Poriferisodalis sp. TaxID=3101277 RepID=UPI003B5A2711
MANFTRGSVDIHYDDYGSGFPLLLIAPGGMRSAAAFWEQSPWNPITQLSDRYRVIAMDQRNAGRSTAPVSADDGWATYTADQLALMDHLGCEQFHLAGMCIGGPYIMGLIQAAPERVASATLFQTIGLDENRHAFYDIFDDWAQAIRDDHPEADEAAWDQFRSNMYDGDNFLFNVDRDFVATVQTPLLVLLGNDLYHPESSSRIVHDAAPNSTMIEDWMDGSARTAAMEQFAAFLAEHTSAVSNSD